MSIRQRLLYPQAFVNLCFIIEFLDVANNDKSDMRLASSLLVVVMLIYFVMIVDFSVHKVISYFDKKANN